MSKLLNRFNDEYEKILHSGLSEDQKTMEYSSLMTEMEHEFKIPIIRDPEWERENRKIIALYRKISMSRKL